jgi:predicted chitinase
MSDHALAERTLLTADQLRAIMAAQPGLAVDTDAWAAPLAAAMAKWGITSAPARAAFLAICGEETRGFHGRRARLNTSAARMAPARDRRVDGVERRLEMMERIPAVTAPQ